jgi:hypothetical protein
MGKQAVRPKYASASSVCTAIELAIEIEAGDLGEIAPIRIPAKHHTEYPATDGVPIVIGIVLAGLKNPVTQIRRETPRPSGRIGPA